MREHDNQRDTVPAPADSPGGRAGARVVRVPEHVEKVGLRLPVDLPLEVEALQVDLLLVSLKSFPICHQLIIL